MARKEDADVDPRFDPVFQRGYDPAQHGRSAHRQGSSSHAASSAAPAHDVRPLTPTPKYHQAEPVITDAAGIAEAARPSHPATDPVGAVLNPVATEDDDEYEPPRRNPYRLILLLTSLAAIGGAGLLFWKRLVADPYGGYGGYGGDVAQLFFQQFVDALLTPLLTAGLLGVCLWLALGALKRRDHG
jgi:hypothetical protein